MTSANINTAPAQDNFRTDVKVRLIQRGLTVTALARKLKRSRNAVSIAINHASMFPSLKKRIRKEVGL